MVKLLHVLVNRGHCLNARAPTSDDRDPFTLEVDRIVVCGGVVELALKVVESWNIWPFPCTERLELGH